jgi:8-oxo-dGTP pyrophosphatase MutT (NUDIX family)
MTPEQMNGLQYNLSAQPGLLGREDYRSAAVLMLLMLRDGEYHFVLEERHPEIRQGGEISFPGGQFDLGRDVDTGQTAIRETVEELGIPEERLSVVGALGTLVNAAAGMTVDAYVGVGMFQDLDELQINDSEVKSVFAVPVSGFERSSPEEYHTLVQVHPTCVDESTGQERILLPAEQLGLPERYTRPWGTTQHRVLVYHIDGYMVWGTTARLIYEMIRRLK